MIGISSERRRLRWPLAYVLLAVTIAALVGSGGPLATGITWAQDDASPTELAADPSQVEQPPAGAIETESDQPPAEETEPEQEPVDEPLVEDDDGTVETEATPENTGAGEIDLQPTATETPPLPALRYTPAEQPNCVPSQGQPALIAHGAFLDYDCTFALGFAGEHLAAADIQLDWTVQAVVDGGWTVQLLPPPTDPGAEAIWTEAQAMTQFAHRGTVWEAPSAEIAESLDAASELTFGLRVHRAICSAEAQSVQLDLTVDASLPELTLASIEQLGPQPATYQLAPELAPIPEPTVAFTGALDFGEVKVTTEGPVSTPAPGQSVLTVTGLDQACGDYRLTVASTPFNDNAAETDDEIHTVGPSEITLALTSIDGVTLPEGGCAFANGCAIAIVPAGPEAAPVATFTLGVLLVLPDQPRAAVFNASLSAALERVSPGSDPATAAQPERAAGQS